MESCYGIKNGLDIMLIGSLYKKESQLRQACYDYMSCNDYDEKTMLSFIRSYRAFLPVSDYLRRTTEESEVINKITDGIDIADIRPIDFTVENISTIIDSIIESIDEKRSEYQKQFNQTIDIDDDDERLAVQAEVMSKRKELSKPKDFFIELKKIFDNENGILDISTTEKFPVEVVHSEETTNFVKPDSEENIYTAVLEDVSSDISDSHSEHIISEISHDTLKDAIVTLLFNRKYLSGILTSLTADQIIEMLSFSDSANISITRIKRICAVENKILCNPDGTYEYNDGKIKSIELENEEIISDEELTEAIVHFLYEKKDDIFHPDGYAAEEILDELPAEISQSITVARLEEAAKQCNKIYMPSLGYFMYNNAEEYYDDSLYKKNDETLKSAASNLLNVEKEESDIDKLAILENPNISFTLNNRKYDAFDWSEVLCKVCEYLIRKAPFRMARIASRQLYHNGKMIFYRKSVPVENYNKLSNGLQVIKISSKEEFNPIYNELSEYCQTYNKIIFDQQ
ncbi:MAG: hypothetical protein J6A37_10740 [Oscillospiraceae bacterium]|nr:hypothetical protein [Oscillospiraceae bacterium]